MKIINVALNTLLILVIFGAVAFFLAPRFGLLNPFELKIVRSGSMEPAIPTGSVVLIQPSASYKVGDVITFGKDTATSIPTSHRIVSTRSEGGTTYYTTKGDANNAADPGETPANKVIGRIIFSLPYVGYIFAFAKTRLGFALLVAIPAALIILYEAIGIYKEVAMRKRRKKAEGALARIAERTVDDLNDPRTKREAPPTPPRTRISLLHFDIEAPMRGPRFSP